VDVFLAAMSWSREGRPLRVCCEGEAIGDVMCTKVNKRASGGRSVRGSHMIFGISKIRQIDVNCPKEAD
jgi:hypothetical protein